MREISLKFSLLTCTHSRKYSTQAAYNLWIRFGTIASVRAARVGGCTSYNNVMPNAGCHMQLVSIWDHLPCG